MSRLIDADALIAQMEADAEQMEEPIAKMFTYAAIRDVKHAPTIEERKTGRWTHAWGTDDAIWKCSKCGFEIDAHGYDPVEYLETYKFCPNCGSDNREEGDRDEPN